MYKIIIVDDEEEIRLGVIKKIDWNKYGFIVVGEAENGQEALELSEKLHPDVIMTDIKMPFMNGLELGEKIADIMPSTKIIIFSGSDDLEYAHQAIKINVIEYVLKPINSMELIKVLERLKEKLDKEYAEKSNIEKLEKHYNESIPVIREQLLIGALEGRVSNKQWNESKFKLGLDFINENISIALINIDDIDNIENSGLRLISIKNIVDETLNKQFNFIAFPYIDKILVLISLNKREDILQLINNLNEICKIYQYVFNSTISIGIGKICNNINDIKFSYRTSQSALGYRQILGNNKSIFIEDVEPDSSIQIKFEDQEEVRFLNAIKLSKEKEIIREVECIFRKVESSFVSLDKYKIYLMEVITSMIKLIQEYNLEINKVFGEEFNFFTYLDKFNSIEEIKNWLIKKSIEINSIIKKERVNSAKILVNKAKEYIKQNYNDSELSVEKLCFNLHVSPTYFSTIFKKETDMSFINYLTDLRLEEALKLLNTTDYKTYIIAEKVGYQEANYFSYVFKKKFGIAPSRYRKN